MGHLEPAELAATWSTYKTHGGQDLRYELVVHYQSLVRYVANKIGITMPPEVDREDLVSYGMIGLIDAIDKFSLDKGVKFETYGVARIRGAIIDEIRSLDWVPRSVRTKGRDIEKCKAELEMTLGRPPSHEEIADALSLSMESYWTRVSEATITQITSGNATPAYDEDNHVGAGDNYQDPTANPEDLIQAGEVVDLVGEAISNMDERSKTILVLYYLQEMTLAEIGQILGVTESRVCQLQSKVLQALRESLGQGGLVAA